ncbi:hypothetical protein BGZ93_007468 [Podila epicladia]|nr:hypothetical protein BGZ93_007468 [Podila epicladia]
MVVLNGDRVFSGYYKAHFPVIPACSYHSDFGTYHARHGIEAIEDTFKFEAFDPQMRVLVKV